MVVSFILSNIRYLSSPLECTVLSDFLRDPALAVHVPAIVYVCGLSQTEQLHANVCNVVALQGNGMHPLTASQHSSVPPQAGPSPFPPAVPAVSTFRTQSCPPSVNGGNEGSWASTPQVSVVQGVHQAHGSQSDGLFVPLNMHMNGSAMSGVNPSISFSHGSVRLESHGQTHGSQRSGGLMQQATSVLVATNNAHQGLLKQHGTGVNSMHMKEAAFVSKPKSSGGVHIVDVTESLDESTQPVPGTDEGLPFPAFELA